METPFVAADRLIALPSHSPAPGLGLLPVHAYLLRGTAPVLIDAGMAVEAPAFLDALDTVMDVHALRALVITHEDADHTGALPQLLARAPHASVITTAVGAGKLSAALRLPFERLVIVGPGQSLTLGDRTFRVLPAPLYDSPATFMLREEREGWLFASDAFGAFVPENVERADALDRDVLLQGMERFCCANSPWLARVDARAFAREVAALADTRLLLASHLPPASGAVLADVLLRAARLPEVAATPEGLHAAAEASVHVEALGAR